MDDALAFRNSMAEAGFEYTPAQATKCMKLVEKFRRVIHKHAREDPTHFERLASLSLQEKQRLCRRFAEKGKEITAFELNNIIDLILYVYEQEKLY